MIYVAFIAFILLMLLLDLGLYHRKPHVIQMKEALGWSAFWVSLALLFNLVIYITHGGEVALTFLTAYIVEQALSIDNLFIFLLIFRYFAVPRIYMHYVLFWGIIGAIIMRGAFIFAGVAMIQQFHFMLYIFGAFLVYGGIQMAFQKDEEIHPERNIILNFFKKWMPVTKDYVDKKLFVKEKNRWFATPLFIVILAVESTDLIFALDSIPAVIALSRDPFIIYTSNIFAILGLRSFFFALEHFMQLFHYLHYGLSAILVFIGSKMLLEKVVDVPISIALLIVAILLVASMTASLLFPQRTKSQ